MTSIDQITGQNPQGQAASRQLNQDFDDFLTLLTTQLKNQDPLEQMDTTEFTNQLVQFSQVEQQLRTNDTLEDMRALGMLQITDIGLGFVGMDVQMEGNNFDFDGTSEVELGYNLPEASKNTQLIIKDAEGETVYSVDGELLQGQKKFTWDGKNNDGFAVDPGLYSFEVAAQNLDGKALKTPTSVPGSVSGIESDGTGNVMLVIGSQKVPITDVTRATLPKTVTPPPTPEETIN